MTNEEFRAVFSRRIKDLRQSRHLTQRELGLSCGYPETTAERRARAWERGELLPPIDKLRILSQVLDVMIDDIIPQ